MPEYYDPAEFTKGNETWYDYRLWSETSNTRQVTMLPDQSNVYSVPYMHLLTVLSYVILYISTFGYLMKMV
jgi:hypothetical protein